jgi:hypothetical protein
MELEFTMYINQTQKDKHCTISLTYSTEKLDLIEVGSGIIVSKSWREQRDSKNGERFIIVY